MGCVSIPFRRLPHQPKLFVRLIDDYSSVKQFYAHPPNMDAVKEVASSLDYPAERRDNQSSTQLLNSKSTHLKSHHQNISYAPFFFNDPATTEIYTLPLHDPLPILCLYPFSAPAAPA